MKQVLDPNRDRSAIQVLELKAVAHRRRLLELGHSLKIRLHYGGSMSAVEILDILYFRWMNFDPSRPDWAERDRFVLSKGHAAPSLYVALAMAGFFTDGEFNNFRRMGSSLQGHPDREKTPGVDCSSGSLGQGFPVACGMAISSKMDQSTVRVYALLGDGECNEGSIWEAALIAANLRLDTLTALVDRNGKSSYGPMQGRNDVEPLADKWAAFGWEVILCNGHSFVELSRALAQAEAVQGKPRVILCDTIKGKGIPFAEENPTRSNFALTEEQYQGSISHLNDEERRIRNERAD
jgi:transketolase